MEKQKVTDEQLTSQVGNIIDELAAAGKKAVGTFFGMMVQRTADTASDLTDKGVNKLKKTIDKKVSNDENQTD